MSKVLKSSTQIRKSRRTRWIIIIVLLIVLLTAALAVCAMVSMPYESIDLSIFAIVDYTGYNTAGKAEVSLDEEAVDALLAKLKQDYDDALFHNTKPEDADYFNFKQSLECSLDKTEGLANGSTVTVNIKYDKELADRIKLEVTGNSSEIVISGLPTVTKLSVDQLFEDLEVTFSGVSPNLTISMKNNSDNPFIKQMGFEIVDPKEYYAEGDVVTVKANYTDELTEETHYIVDASPEECTREYTAPAGAKYLTSASELPSDIIDEAVAAGKGAFTDANAYGVRVFCEANLVPVYINKKATFVYGTPNLVSAYFKTILPEKVGTMGYDYNDLDIIYSVTITQADGVSCQAYAAVRFSDIILNEDGSYSYDFSDPKILSESYYAARVKKNVTDAYANTHEIEKVR